MNLESYKWCSRLHVDKRNNFAHIGRYCIQRCWGHSYWTPTCHRKIVGDGSNAIWVSKNISDTVSCFSVIKSVSYRKEKPFASEKKVYIESTWLWMLRYVLNDFIILIVVKLELNQNIIQKAIHFIEEFYPKSFVNIVLSKTNLDILFVPHNNSIKEIHHKHLLLQTCQHF